MLERNLRDDSESTGGFDFKRLLLKLAVNYKWFLLTLLLCGAGAYIYLRYTAPLYIVNTFVQLQQPQEAASAVGTPFAQKSTVAAKALPDINGEIFKLQSTALIGEVVDSLGLDIAVTVAGQKAPADSLPFEISVTRAFPENNSGPYRLVLLDSSFRFGPETDPAEGLYNHPLVILGDTVTVRRKSPLPAISNLPYQVQFDSRPAVISRYIGRLTISSIPKTGIGMLHISLRDEIEQRARKFIEVLIYRYDLANFNFRNKSLRSEMEFLDNRLASVNAELEKQENNVRDFKASNKINDISSSANQLLTNLSSIDSRKSDNQYRESLVNLVEKNVNINSGQEERINVPGLDDADLVALVTQYNNLVSQKKNILVQGTANDLRLPAINAKLQESRNAILNRITAIRAELRNSNDFLDSQEKSTTGRFVGLPEKEKDYIQVNRLLNVKQTLLIFLLQRKEDMNIEYASSGIGGTRFVDWRLNGQVHDPKPLMIYLAALAAGLLVPVSVITTRFLLNKRIETPEEIYNATSLPIAGEIIYEKKSREGVLITQNNVSPVAEQFRTLRANIFYINRGAANKVLLVSSAISGEGKSFVSLNLANAIAISNKKIVLLEFDLRNPSLSDKIGFSEEPGISNYLEGTAEAADIIKPVEGYGNLYFISAGHPLSAHPGEAILSSRVQTLFEYLRGLFDYIVVDTPPIENVSDALTLGRLADSSFFVIRHKYSLRSSLTLFNRLYEDKKLPNPALIINGIIPGDGFHNVYGYGYGEAAGSRKKRKQGKLKKIA